MVFGFFKDGDELFDEAQELIRQKEYAKASKKLRSAIEKESEDAPLARVMIEFIEVGQSLNDAGRYRELSAALQDLEGTFDFGLSTFDVRKLKDECDAMATAITARNMHADSGPLLITKGEALIEAAKILQQKVGNEILSINEYFNTSTLSGTRLSISLMAEGNELIADGTYWSDPKKAAEYQQIAYNFRRQLGESGEYNKRKIKEYTMTCTCWICGRQATGEGLHFYRMSADISPEHVRADEGELAPSTDSGSPMIFVCKACYTSISRRADSIAKEYHDRSMMEIEAVQRRMMAEIARLDSRITSVSIAARR